MLGKGRVMGRGRSVVGVGGSMLPTPAHALEQRGRRGGLVRVRVRVSVRVGVRARADLRPTARKLALS